MTKTEFMDLYEELSVLNESAGENFEKSLVPKFNALKADIDKTIKVLDNPNYAEALEDLKSLVNGFKICQSVNKQLMAIGSKAGQMINGPYDEANGILNMINHLIFIAKQGDTAVDRYLKDRYDWTVDSLKELLKDYEKFSDVSVSDIDFSDKQAATAVTNKSTEEAPEQKAEPKNAKLNRARQNNSKIMKAFKEVGLATDDLVVTAKNKNGKNYRKASDKLNKLRKTLFGESFDENETGIEIEEN